MNLEERKAFEEKIVIRDYPYSISVESTAFCNLHCKMCANSTMKRRKGFMDMELFKKIADEAADKFPQSNFWMNGYGEPLLNKNFVNMVKYAVDAGISKTFVNTNAMLLDDKTADALIESGIHGIVVSIDGYSKEVYESIRMGGDRDVVYHNVLNMLKKINNMEGDKPVFEIQFIEIPEIMHEQEMWYEFWKDKGAKIKFKSYTTWGGAVDSVEGTEENRMACGDCNVLDIMWDGSVPYCATGDVECEYILGNANTEKLYDIWQRKKQNFCQYHLDHQFDKLPPSCQKCPDWRAMPAKHIATEGKNM